MRGAKKGLPFVSGDHERSLASFYVVLRALAYYHRAMIRIDDTLSIGEHEISVSYIRASGPGGQNVNKVSSAAQLRFDARNSPSLQDGVRMRLERIAGSRLTKDGVIVITANRFRTQNANYKDAVDRLVEMIRQAMAEPKKRVATKPGPAANRRRLEGKTRRSALKRTRSAHIDPDA